MKTKLVLISLMGLSIITPKLRSSELAKHNYTSLASDFSKAVLAGCLIKTALKLATSTDIEILGHKIHKKSDSIKIRIIAEMFITCFEILRREWDGTADCCNAKSIFDDSKILIKIIGKVIGMRIPIPFIKT